MNDHFAPAKQKQLPTHDVKMRGKSGFEKIGVAWQRDDGSVFVRLTGTQVVADGFTLYPVDDNR